MYSGYGGKERDVSSMFKPERTMELNEEIRLRSALRLSGVSVKDDDVRSRSDVGIHAFENWIAAGHIEEFVAAK